MPAPPSIPEFALNTRNLGTLSSTIARRSSRVTLVGPWAIHRSGHNVDQLDALSGGWRLKITNPV